MRMRKLKGLGGIYRLLPTPTGELRDKLSFALNQEATSINIVRTSGRLCFINPTRRHFGYVRKFANSSNYQRER